jgi:hypothetical protein
MSNTDQNMRTPLGTPKGRGKRVYRTPSLSRFGDAAELTRAMGGMTGMNDGGGGPDKTSP